MQGADQLHAPRSLEHFSTLNLTKFHFRVWLKAEMVCLREFIRHLCEARPRSTFQYFDRGEERYSSPDVVSSRGLLQAYR